MPNQSTNSSVITFVLNFDIVAYILRCWLLTLQSTLEYRFGVPSAIQFFN